MAVQVLLRRGKTENTNSPNIYFKMFKTLRAAQFTTLKRPNFVVIPICAGYVHIYTRKLRYSIAMIEIHKLMYTELKLHIANRVWCSRS